MEKKQIKDILTLFDEVKKELNVQKREEPEKDKKESSSKKEDKKQKKQVDKKITNIEKIELEFINLLEENKKLEEARLIAVADNQNTVRRFQNESLLVKKYGGEKLATELIPSIELFKSVIKSAPDNPEIKNYLMGFEMIINQIDQGLSNAGVSMIEVKPGDKFNPELHSAIEQVEDKKFSSGQISSIISNGYKLHDRVIKHAAVKVAK